MNISTCSYNVHMCTVNRSIDSYRITRHMNCILLTLAETHMIPDGIPARHPISVWAWLLVFSGCLGTTEVRFTLYCVYDSFCSSDSSPLWINDQEVTRTDQICSSAMTPRTSEVYNALLQKLRDMHHVAFLDEHPTATGNNGPDPFPRITW